MTSSNGDDWFPPAEECSKKQRITVEFTEDTVSQLAAYAEDQDRSIAGQIRFVCKQWLLNKTSLLQSCTPVLDSARRSKAGEGEKEESVTTDHLPLQHFDHQQHSASKAVSPLLDSLKPKEKLGKESEETPCKKPKQTGDPYDRKTLKPEQIPEELRHLEELIIEFWKTKKGSRTSARFQRLINKLSKWDEKDQKSALIAACNSGWGDVFEPKPQASPGSNRFQKPEPRHPQQPIKGSVSPEVAARLEADRAKGFEPSPELTERIRKFREERGYGGQRS